MVDLVKTIEENDEVDIQDEESDSDEEVKSRLSCRTIPTPCNFFFCNYLILLLPKAAGFTAQEILCHIS